jgi:hypothetical protein
MSILSKEPDGVGFYYGFLEGDHRQINVRFCGGMHCEGYWQAFVGGEEIDKGQRAFLTKEAAEAAAIKWAKEHSDGQ